MKKPTYRELMGALRIYDACVGELSFYVGHTRMRAGQAAGDRAAEVCAQAMEAKAILDRAEAAQ